MSWGVIARLMVLDLSLKFGSQFLPLVITSSTLLKPSPQCMWPMWLLLFQLATQANIHHTTVWCRACWHQVTYTEMKHYLGTVLYSNAAEVSLSNTLNLYQPQVCCSVALPDFWSLNGGKRQQDQRTLQIYINAHVGKHQAVVSNYIYA